MCMCASLSPSTHIHIPISMCSLVHFSKPTASIFGKQIWNVCSTFLGSLRFPFFKSFVLHTWTGVLLPLLAGTHFIDNLQALPPEIIVFCAGKPQHPVDFAFPYQWKMPLKNIGGNCHVPIVTWRVLGGYSTLMPRVKSREVYSEGIQEVGTRPFQKELWMKTMQNRYDCFMSLISS